MRGFVNLLLLFTAVQTSNSQNSNAGGVNRPLYPNFPNEYFGIKENVLQEEKFYYFDTDLLQAISSAEPHANIFISPLSIKTALTMILEGSANESANEIRNALRLPNDLDLIRGQFKELLQQFDNTKQGVTLKLGNRVFVSHKLTPIQRYIDILEKFYFSNVTKVNFSNAKNSADIVNRWVTDETHGFITSIADPGTFSPDTSIFLANALYFKGVWLRSFSEQGTQIKCFQLLNGDCQYSYMMDVVENFKYGELKQLDAKIIELPYTGEEFSMVVLLPYKKNGIHQLARDIRTSINNYVNNLTESEVYVTLPRFSIEYSTDLVKYLPSVNIHTISNPNADLSGLTVQLQGRVTKILHKARIEVNEEGTVAAAVTGAVVIPLMGSMKPRFRANHPFLFFIRHKPSGTILFEGRVMTPEKAVQQQQHEQQQHQQQQQQLNPIQQNIPQHHIYNNNKGFPSASQPEQQSFPQANPHVNQNTFIKQQDPQQQSSSQIQSQITETQNYQHQPFISHQRDTTYNTQQYGQNRNNPNTNRQHEKNQPNPNEERIHFEAQSLI